MGEYSDDEKISDLLAVRFVDTNNIHFREPLTQKFKEVFSEVKLGKNQSKKFRLVIEWFAQNSKNSDLRFITVYELDSRGRLKLESIFNQHMYLSLLQVAAAKGLFN